MPWRQSPPHDMQDTACHPAEPGCPVAAWVDAMTGFEQPAYVLALDGRFVWVNEACAALFGRPAAELLQLRFQDLTHPDDHAGDRQRIGRLIKGEVRWLRADKRFLRPDGSSVWVRLNVHRPWRDPAAASPELAERLLVLARLGGDEFVVLMRHLRDPADAALYRAKELGRGTFAYFTQELTQAAARRMELEARLRRAVREQRLALQAMGCDRYQGYWQGGRPTEAMEVLARWQQARAI